MSNPMITKFFFPIKNAGFTFAEVLITLVVIGIIAAITIPTIIVEHNKEQTLSKLKKAYSTLSQAANRAIFDYGPIDTWELGPINNPVSAAAFYNKYLIPYLNVSGKLTSYTDGQWMNTRILLNNNKDNYDSKYVRFYMIDGTSITGYVQFSNSSKKSVATFIDINGDKKPNKLGRDIFQFYFMIKYDDPTLLIYPSFIPTGGVGFSREQLLSDSEYMCNKNQSGQRCSALIMKDGWKISKDYPW